jgi:hypothetical protein
MGKLPKMESKKQKPYKAPKVRETVAKAPEAPKFKLKRAGSKGATYNKKF